MFSPISQPSLAKLKRRRAWALAAIVSVLIQTLVPARLWSRPLAESWLLAEGVERVEDAELAKLWGGAQYIVPHADARAGVLADMGNGHTYLRENDVSVPLMDGLALTMARTQSSQQFSSANDSGSTILGVSWWSEWDSIVTLPTALSGVQTWIAPWGESIAFNYSGSTGSVWTWYSDVDQGVAAKMELKNSGGYHYVVTDKAGNEYWYVYGSGRGQLVYVKNPRGRTITIERDTSGNAYRPLKVKAESGDGRYLQFAYKTSTNLLETVTLKSTYNGGYSKLLVTYNYGNASNPFVPSSNLRSVEFPNGYEKRFAYGSYEESGGSWTHQTDAYNDSKPSRTLAERSVYYDNGSGWSNYPLYRASWYEYSEGSGWILDESYLTHEHLYDFEASVWDIDVFEYDLNIVGTFMIGYWADGGDIIIDGTDIDTYEADSKGDITSIEFWYDSTSNPSYKVDRHRFRTISKTYRAPGYTGSGVDATTAFETSHEDTSTHTAYGNPDSSIDFLNRTTDYTFSSSYNLPTSTIDVASNETTATYNADRQVTGTEDILGRTASYTYTSDLLTSHEDELGRVTDYTYYASGAENYGRLETVESPDGITTTTDYNMLGQVTSVSSSPTGVTIDYTYTDTSMPWSVLDEQEDNLTNVTSYTYDSRGLVTSVTNPLNKTTEFEYDPAGRLIKTINPLNHETERIYDSRGRLVQYIDERDKNTYYEYDASNRIVEIRQHDNTTETFDYTGAPCGCSPASPASMKPVAKTTREGDDFDYTYDVMGRLTKIDYELGRDVTFDYTYHATNNKYSNLAYVRDTNFSSGWDGDYDFEYTYDAYGRQTKERFPDGQDVRLEYNADGLVEDVKFNASTFTTSYTYDALARLDVVSNSLSQTADWAYYTSSDVNKGLPQTITYSNGVVSTFEYDSVRRLLRYKADPVSGSDEGRYNIWDADGTLLGVYDHYAPNWATYTGYRWRYYHDDAGQLTGEDREFYSGGSYSSTAVSLDYTYDAAGNRESRTGSGTGYELFDDVPATTFCDDLNQLCNYKLGSYTHVANNHNNNGQLISKYHNNVSPAFNWTYSWSEDGRLTQAEDAVSGTDIKYVYDWQGRLLEREDETASANGPKRRYYYHGLTPLAERTATYSGSYTWSNARYNTLAPGSAGHVTMQRTVSGSVDRFLHYDHIDNVILESNTSGAFAAEHEQDAFGRPVLSDAAGGWDHNSLHQTTKHWDDSTGLFYFNARWYDPATGTFLSTAPMSRAKEHPYGFNLNNPLILIDSTGNKATTINGCREEWAARNSAIRAQEALHIANIVAWHAGQYIQADQGFDACILRAEEEKNRCNSTPGQALPCLRDYILNKKSCAEIRASRKASADQTAVEANQRVLEDTDMRLRQSDRLLALCLARVKGASVHSENSRLEDPNLQSDYVWYDWTWPY
jgi:RHS repeat-associated protein